MASMAGNSRHGLTSKVDHFGITPLQIIAAVRKPSTELNLPHPCICTANNLGMPGNWTTTLETM